MRDKEVGPKEYLYVLRKEQGSLRVTQGVGRDQLWRRGRGWRGQERSELRNLGMK